MKRLVDRLLRVLLTALHMVLRANWFLRRPKTFGAHAIAITPDGKLVLVKLRYAPGWRVPGGGRSVSEDPVDAALRELREEIGLLSHGEVIPVREFDDPIYFKHDTVSIMVVRDVRYLPRWNLEVEQIGEVDFDALPPDLAGNSAAWIRAARPLL